MCLRLSLRSQMPSPAKRVKATTYRGDSPEVAKLWLQLVFMQLTRDLFAIAKFLLSYAADKHTHTDTKTHIDSQTRINALLP